MSAAQIPTEVWTALPTETLGWLAYMAAQAYQRIPHLLILGSLSYGDAAKKKSAKRTGSATAQVE